MKYIIIILILYADIVFAQIDTADWFPMAKGNYWEYQDDELFVRTGISVVGDTLMPNGKTYSIFIIEDLIDHYIHYSYRRLENNSYLYIWNYDRDCKYYDFTKHVPDVWNYLYDLNRKLVKIDSSFNQLFQKRTLRMEFEDLYINSDGVAMYFERSWQQVYKGIGDVIIGYSGGCVKLVGAVINNQSYGKITSVHNGKTIPSSFALYQNYPNPFNPTTKIKFNLPKSTNTKLIIYDAMGREIATLINAEISAGYHEVEFNGGNLSSGIYLYRIITPNYIATKKLVLMK